VAARFAVFLARGQFIANDLVAQVDAFVADEHRGAGDELLDLVLALPAERAVKRFLAGRAFLVGHGFLGYLASMIAKRKRRHPIWTGGAVAALQPRMMRQGRCAMTWSTRP